MKGAETLKPLWLQKAGLEPVDLFESAVKHRAGGYTAQRMRNRERRGQASMGKSVDNRERERERGEKKKPSERVIRCTAK